MSELVKAIERQLGNDMIEEGNMNAYDVLEIIKNFKQPQLDKRQLAMLHDLKANYNCHQGAVEWAIYVFLTDDECGKIMNKDLFEILDEFKQWVLEQEEAE
ncbi:hypothetical protein EMQU_2508 [Enterococcus mundtii QU 25]|uniref:hypothetical protein n=1 Tax=Enterococcus mundtii TaxID=53346 RepID=UPI0003C555AD|nr:hypothetical protein [Enterococcus mundtii]BAO08065.1 hypothetical protein EMQU_2508 [Enterococcus mundtii QU 25]